MESKKKKQLYVLAGVLVLLIFGYWGITSYNRNQIAKEAEKEKENAIYMTDVSEVTSISYTGTESQSFKKDSEGEWYVAEDKDFPLDSEAVNLLVDTYSQLVAERQLNDGDEFSAYGLDQPQYTVELTGKDGNVTKIYIGNEVEDSYYATVEGKKSVYTISADKVTGLQTSLDDMAVLDQFPTIGNGNLVSEEIKTKGGTTEYKASQKDDAEAVAVVVGGLSVLKLDDPTDYHMADSDASKYGLDDENKTTVNIVYTEDQKENKITLYVGKEDGAGNQYVQLKDSKIVYRVSNDICNNILNNHKEK